MTGPETLSEDRAHVGRRECFRETLERQSIPGDGYLSMAVLTTNGLIFLHEYLVNIEDIRVYLPVCKMNLQICASCELTRHGIHSRVTEISFLPTELRDE